MEKGSMGFVISMVGLVLAIFIVNILVPVFKPIAVQQAYNSQQSYNITLSSGAQSVLTPATTVDYKTTASLWDLVTPIFNVLGAIALFILGILYALNLVKHKHG